MQSINLPKKQSGASLIAILVIVAMVVLLGAYAVKVLPTHWEHRALASVLDNMEQDRSIRGQSAGRLAALLEARINTNGIYGVTGKNIRVGREDGFDVVSIDYVVKKNLYKNTDVVITFKDSARIPRR